VRVIAGTWRGRRLEAPRWGGLRPTSDRLRETLFNVLAPRVEGARLLDAYAGTGAVGIEALSRGAAHVTFIDRDRRAAALIRSNLARCGLPDNGVVLCHDVALALARRAAPGPYAIIFLDPPYDRAPAPETLDAAAGLLEPGGLLILEHARRVAPLVPSSLHVVRALRAGDSVLCFCAAAPGGAETRIRFDPRAGPAAE